MILAIDQGTTGTTTVLYNKEGQIVTKAYREFTQHYPKPGWVEHDPEEIWQTVLDTVHEITSNNSFDIKAIGITNQRETTVVWNKKTGKAVYNAIVWQCRRTTEMCADLEQHTSLFREKTGLPLDAYFSGTKIKWILDHVQDDANDLLFGTIDSWLLWKLTNGEVHATDFTNASRTLLFNIKEKKWDEELCNIIGVPLTMLPPVKNSMDNYGVVRSIEAIKNIPLFSLVGDQQAALFGQTCFEKGEVKNTYGTGCFLLINTGGDYIQSKHGLITTLAVGGDGKPCYALEGSVFIGGAVIQWLRDELGLLKSAKNSEEMALSVTDTAGAYVVPAFVGLGAPYWNSQARGTIVGITRGVHKHHIVRAALESIAYQSYDVLTSMEKDCKVKLNNLSVDGGAAANNFLLQFQADVLGISVTKPTVIESTSLGAAYLAGIQAGFWNTSEVKKLRKVEQKFEPIMSPEKKEELLKGWHEAVRKTIQ